VTFDGGGDDGDQLIEIDLAAVPGEHLEPEEGGCSELGDQGCRQELADGGFTDDGAEFGGGVVDRAVDRPPPPR
jgi:hypothetical protein